MKVLMFSTDQKVFERNSEVRERMVQYGTLFDEMHIVVFNMKKHGREAKNGKISPNVSIYSTDSYNRLFALYDFYAISKKIIKSAKFQRGTAVITSQDAMTNIPALFLKMHCKIPLHVQIHTDFTSSYFKKKSIKNFIHYIGYRLGLWCADCIRVVSRRIYDSLKDLGVKDYESKTSILPIYIDARAVRGAPPSDIRSRYPQFDFLILWVGRFEKEKNAKLALSVVREVLRREEKVGLLYIGDGSERARLEKTALRTLVRDHVIFEGWQENTAPYYKSADVLLVTSLYEGYGRQIVEARIAGLPVVATPVGVAEEAGACIVSWDVCEIARTIIAQKNGAQFSRSEYAYPYKDKEQYLKAFKETFTKCISSNPKK